MTDAEWRLALRLADELLKRQQPLPADPTAETALIELAKVDQDVNHMIALRAVRLARDPVFYSLIASLLGPDPA